MRILWVATKAPTPITDGGRAVMLATIEALAAIPGARLTVVTPLPIDGDSGQVVAAAPAVRRLAATARKELDRQPDPDRNRCKKYKIGGRRPHRK